MLDSNNENIFKNPLACSTHYKGGLFSTPIAVIPWRDLTTHEMNYHTYTETQRHEGATDIHIGTTEDAHEHLHIPTSSTYTEPTYSHPPHPSTTTEHPYAYRNPPTPTENPHAHKMSSR